MAPDVLDRRALNRALLARQLLLRRMPAAGAAAGPGRVLTVVGQLAGLQAQAPFPPYYMLWSRLAGFQPAELADLLLGRQAVRIALMCGTIHLVSAGDPPRAVWGRAGRPAHTSAEAWLGQPLDGRPLDGQAAASELARRYLAAFGPATVADVQAWSGLTRLAAIIERLRPGLRTFRDEAGRELFDLPDAPRPDPATPAPARLIAEFDNLILSHADRSRVISESARKRLFARQNVFPGTVLVDGFAAGSWRLSSKAGAVTLGVELFGPVPQAARDEISREGEDLLAFAAPDAGTREIVVHG